MSPLIAAPTSPPVAYRICTRCVMDTSDPEIEFDADGVCNHCRDHARVLAANIVSGSEGEARLEAIAARVRRAGGGRPYDCVIGVSGGIDSTYTAWLVRRLGLRPIAVHLDNGWNSDIAVRNIASALERLQIDLDTYVIDWEEFRDIQRAFLLASVPDVEVPTDHAILACLARAASRYGIGTVISGHNDRTESHLPRAWSRGHLDYGYIRDVHTRFGSGRIRTFPHLGFTDFLRLVRRGSSALTVLNYADYGRERARELIERELGWQDYGGKHHESVFTRWYQGCYLPRKFGFDKRRAHLSSLVSTGQTTRAAALAALQPPPYAESLQEEDCVYVAKRLGFDRPELDAILAAEPRCFEDFRSYQKVIDGGAFRTVRRVGRAARQLMGGTG